MARPLRLEWPGGAVSRDVEDDEDRAAWVAAWVAALGQACGRFGWRAHAWWVMTNDDHLLVETPAGRLSAGMRHLNRVWSQCFNRRHGRVGHVFQGRYKAIMVERDADMAAAYASGAHTLRSVAKAFGVHEATVSRALRRQATSVEVERLP